MQINKLMNPTDFRRLLTLFEARGPNFNYEELEDKVIVQLRSHDSRAYTLLAQKVDRVKQLKEEVKVLEDEIKQSTRENIADLFSAEDAVKTRIVQTMSLILQLSKDPEATVAPKYKDILEALTVHLTPELILVLEQLKKTMVTVTQKSAGLKIKNLDEDLVGNLFADLNNIIADWATGYDQELARLQQELTL